MSFDNPLTPEDVDDSATNPMSSPIESIMAMFLMSMTNFGDYYGAFPRTEHEYEAKVMFQMKILHLKFFCVDIHKLQDGMFFLVNVRHIHGNCGNFTY